MAKVVVVCECGEKHIIENDFYIPETQTGEAQHRKEDNEFLCSCGKTVYIKVAIKAVIYNKT